MYVISIYGIVLGAISAFMRGRDPMSILNLSFRAPYVMIAGLALQIGLTVLAALDRSFPRSILAFTFLVIIVGLLLNRNLHGVRWVALGAAVNTIVVSLNGGLMPVSTHSLDLAGLHNLILHINGNNSRHFTSNHFKSLRLWWLGDWIPLFKQVASPGDLCVGIGLFLFVYCNAQLRVRAHETK